MILDFKVLVAGGGVESFVLSINYFQLNFLSTFSILYHLLFRSYTFFQLQNWLFQIFLLNSLSEWSQLAPEIQNSKSIAVFKNKLLSFIRPSKRSIFNVNYPEEVKYLTWLRLPFSHLNKHKFRHSFLDTLNPLYKCSLEDEDKEHFFLRCLNFKNARRSPLTDTSNINLPF